MSTEYMVVNKFASNDYEALMLRQEDVDSDKRIIALHALGLPTIVWIEIMPGKGITLMERVWNQIDFRKGPGLHLVRDDTDALEGAEAEVVKLGNAMHDSARIVHGVVTERDALEQKLKDAEAEIADLKELLKARALGEDLKEVTDA